MSELSTTTNYVFIFTQAHAELDTTHQQLLLVQSHPPLPLPPSEHASTSSFESATGVRVMMEAQLRLEMRGTNGMMYWVANIHSRLVYSRNKQVGSLSFILFFISSEQLAAAADRCDALSAHVSRLEAEIQQSQHKSEYVVGLLVLHSWLHKGNTA